MAMNPSDMMSMLGGGQANPDHPHKKKPEVIKLTPQEVLNQAITAAITPPAPAAAGAGTAPTAALSAEQQKYLDDAKQAITNWNQKQKAAYQTDVVERDSGVTITGIAAPISLYNALRHGEIAAANEVTTQNQTHFDNYHQELESSKSDLLTKLAGSTLSLTDQATVKTQLDNMYQNTQTAFKACEQARLNNAKTLFDQHEDFSRAKDHYDQRGRFAASSNFVTKTQNPVTRIDDQADFTPGLRLPPGLTKAYVNVYRYEDSKFFRSVRVRAHLSDNPPNGKAAFKVSFADGTSKSVRLEGKENVVGQFEIKGDKLARNVLGIDRPEALQGAGKVKSTLIKGYVGLVDLFKGKNDATISSDDDIIKTMVKSAQAVAAEAFAAGTPVTRFDISEAISSMSMGSQEQLVREMYKAFGPDIKLGTLAELPRLQALRPRQYQPLQPAEPNDNNIKKDTIYIAPNGDYAVRSLDGSKVHRDRLPDIATNPVHANDIASNGAALRTRILNETDAKSYTLQVQPTTAATPNANAFTLIIPSTAATATHTGLTI